MRRWPRWPRVCRIHCPALGRISGVGEKKLEAYGPELLRLLQADATAVELR